MATSQASGSQTAVLTTEHTLATITDAGTYVLLVDTVNMALEDKLTLRAKVKIKSDGTTRLAYEANYEHKQTEFGKISIPVPSIHELIFTLEQNGGTGRVYVWEIIKL